MYNHFKFTLIFFLLATTAMHAQTLKERQAIAGLDFSWAEKRIKDNYGSDVKIELNEPSFTGDLDAILFADQRGGQLTANTFAKICSDDIAKKALKDKKITKVVLINIKEGKYKIKLENSTLTVFQGFSSKENFFSEYELQQEIENLL